MAASDWSDSTEQCVLSLTEESLELLGTLQGVQDWWPHLEEKLTKPDQKVQRSHLGLFVLRQGRKRKAAAKAKVQKGKAKAKAKSSSKKKIILKKKKNKDVQTVLETVENFKRSGVGILLVKQMMHKCRSLDCMKFSNNPLFSDNDLCRMKLGKCHNMPWKDMVDNARSFFKALSLGESCAFCGYYSDL